MSACRLLKWMIAVSCAAICGLVPVASASAAALPDGRVYELVSSLASYGSEVYQPTNGETLGTPTELPFQSAADGDKVAYVGGPSVGGSELSGSSGGNEYLGTRSATGVWTQSTLTPAGAASAIFQAFSSDLSVGILDSVEPLASTAPGFGEIATPNGSYDILYSTNTAKSGDDVPFFTTLPPYRTMENFETAGAAARPFPNGASSGGRGFRTLAFIGASKDSSHLLFLANDALTGASEDRPAAEGGVGSNFEKQDNLYESLDGELRLVNVLPNGSTHVNATFGGGVSGGFGSKFNHVISENGSRIFWTDLSTGHIYMRKDEATTVEISAAGKYQTATSDGSVVFYVNGDLYRYDVEGAQATDLTPGVPVEKVVGASENGQYVYYVTAGGEFKLWHNGVTTTIAAATVAVGEVTPDGHSVVFESFSTGFEGRVSVYDSDTGVVYCTSCTTGGTKSVLLRTNAANVYQARWISADGSRVFYESREALVPQDVNGMRDVYEWERPGAGGCDESTGCVYLLSGASSTQGSHFADASLSGDDVFIVTRAKLAGSDENELFDLYDVRVNGLVPVAPPACTGTGCQGVPGALPIFATPSSVTFEGVGNFAAPAKGVKGKVKPKKKPKHRTKHRKKKSKAKKGAHKANGRKHSGVKGGRS